MDSTYRQQELGARRVQFHVTPASVRAVRNGPMAMAALAAVMIIGTTPGQTGTFGWIVRWFVAIAVGWLVYRGMALWIIRKLGAARSPGGTFTVHAMGIETPSGRIIPRDDIDELTVRNTFPRAKDVSYALCAQVGGQPVTLAGGMEQATATRLMRDVMHVMGDFREVTRDDPASRAPPPQGRPDVAL
jgi:hypothetical protein